MVKENIIVLRLMVSPTYRYHWEFEPNGPWLRVFMYFVAGFYGMATAIALPIGFHWLSALLYGATTVWAVTQIRSGGQWRLYPLASSWNWNLPFFFSIFIDPRTIAPDSSRVPQ